MVKDIHTAILQNIIIPQHWDSYPLKANSPNPHCPTPNPWQPHFFPSIILTTLVPSCGWNHTTCLLTTPCIMSSRSTYVVAYHQNFPFITLTSRFDVSDRQREKREGEERGRRSGKKREKRQNLPSIGLPLSAHNSQSSEPVTQSRSRTWAINCCLAGCASAGSWKQRRSHHPNSGAHKAQRLQFLSPYQEVISYFSASDILISVRWCLLLWFPPTHAQWYCEHLFHMLFGHLCIFLEELCIQAFSPF